MRRHRARLHEFRLGHLSTETYHALVALSQSQKPNWWGRLKPLPEGLWHLIEANSEVMAVPALAAFALKHHNSAGHRAAQLATKLLAPLPLDGLMTIYQRQRHDEQWSADLASRTELSLEPTDLSDLGYLGEVPIIPAGLASFHRNGYVREAALLALARFDTGQELPYLLIGLSDHVANIRRTAEHAVRQRLRPEYAPHFVQCLLLVLRLEQQYRAAAGVALQHVRQFLRSAAAQPALEAGLHASNPTFRRACSELLTTTDSDPARQLLLGVTNPDNLIRLWSVQRLARQGAPELVRQLLPQLLADSYGPVRAEALDLVSEFLPEHVPTACEQGLFDHVRSIRDEARRQLRLRGVTEVAERYRQALSEGRNEWSAITGLGEIGDAADAQRLRPYLEHPRAGLRRAAVKALARLLPQDDWQVFGPLLLDPSAAVSRAARHALERRRAYLDPAELWEAVVQATPQHVKRNTLMLIASLSKWTSLAFLLRAYTLDEPALTTQLNDLLRQWIDDFNRSYAHPASAQRERLLEQLSSLEGKLPAECWKAIWWRLG